MSVRGVCRERGGRKVGQVRVVRTMVLSGGVHLSVLVAVKLRVVVVLRYMDRPALIGMLSEGPALRKPRIFVVHAWGIRRLCGRVDMSRVRRQRRPVQR